jgi:hypothetical protein
MDDADLPRTSHIVTFFELRDQARTIFPLCWPSGSTRPEAELGCRTRNARLPSAWARGRLGGRFFSASRDPFGFRLHE